jgi:hypothetical protein
MHVSGVGFLKAVAALVGEDRPTLPVAPTKAREASRDVDAERALRSAARIVARLRPIAGTLGESYLADVRGIDVAVIRDVLEREDAIGWHPSVYFHQPKVDEPNHELHGQRLGAIIGIMTDPLTARPTGAISRIYIDTNLRKIGKAKTLGSPRGIIRLSLDKHVLQGLHICEGLETGLTGMAIGLRPTWAVGDTDVMRTFPTLSGIECLSVIADHDLKGQGEDAAHEAAARWREAGREVRIFRRSALGDLNDAIKARAA